jgi:hypothetical protein
MHYWASRQRRRIRRGPNQHKVSVYSRILEAPGFVYERDPRGSLWRWVGLRPGKVSGTVYCVSPGALTSHYPNDDAAVLGVVAFLALWMMVVAYRGRG